MLRAHRSSCLAFAALMLTGSALLAGVVPAQATDVGVTATHEPSGPPPQTPARPDVPGHGPNPHDFGWQ
ncbi:hypothetical protein ACFWVP_05295 [Streptomyces sp. NPDC058637]|uniref:hypothetical protein n=1 Tax=Streptomyces sp. NPDC058637 TaxID=3346569 RepID=UPI00364E4D44